MVINLNQFEYIEDLIETLKRIKEKYGNVEYKLDHYNNLYYYVENLI